MSGLRLVGPVAGREAELEAVLRTLPRWFGVEASLLDYARDTSRFPTLVAEGDAGVQGFLTLRPHFDRAWEVHCMAVRATARGGGIGTALLAHAEAFARARGVRFLQVKTIAPAHPSPEYAETRAFYAVRGFEPLEVFPALWGPANPCLQLVKAL